jgi:hypothetical protein
MTQYERLVAVLLIALFSLAVSVVLFRGFRSIALMSYGPFRLGGSVVGFSAVFIVLMYFSLGLSPPEFKLVGGDSGAREAGRAIESFYDLINKEQYEAAWPMLAKSWRDQYFATLSDFKRGYHTTVPGTHQNFSIRPIQVQATTERYLVSFDVVDRYPTLDAQNTLGRKTISALRSMASSRPGELREELIENLNGHFEVSDHQAEELRRFWESAKLEDILAPDLVSHLVVTYGLEWRQGRAMREESHQVQRHFVKIVTMSDVGNRWKIANIENFMMARYDEMVPAVE